MIFAAAVFVFLVHTASATDCRVSIEPQSKVSLELPPASPYELRGNFTATSNVDFCIINSKGIAVYGSCNVSNLIFTFFVLDNGTHLMEFINHNPYNTDVELRYNRFIRVDLSASINIDLSSSATKMSITLPSPEPDDGPDTPDLISDYSNLKGATRILSIIQRSWAYMPIREFFAATPLIVVTTILLIQGKSSIRPNRIIVE